MSVLYLVPVTLSDDGLDHIPVVVTERIRGSKIFIVERLRTARRFIKSLIRDFDIDGAHFIELDKHNLASSIPEINKIMSQQSPICLMSEAGVPCIADPGAHIVHLARLEGYRICPLTGPSSIILGLTASGMNGQQFSFHGYLPIKPQPLSQKLREINKKILKDGDTQIFIETPYRNDKLIQALADHLDPHIDIMLAIDLTAPTEELIHTTIGGLQKLKIGKRPTTYFLGKTMKV